MTHKEASRFLHRMYRELNSGRAIVVLKRMEKFAGLCEGERLLLDPTSEILPTLVHEFLHYFYPDEKHDVIDGLEEQIVSQLTEKQWRNLLIRLAFNLRRCEKCRTVLPWKYQGEQ